MVLLPDEKILMQSEKGILTLTTHRIRKVTRGGGRPEVVSLTLDAVAACELVTKTNPLVLVLALVMGVFGTGRFHENSAEAIVALLIAFALAALYYDLRTPILRISSPGNSIVVPTKGMPHETQVDFIDAVERAKLERIGKL
jgi:hypothetical protein